MDDNYTFLIDTVKNISPLNDDETLLIRNHFVEKQVQKNEIFLEAGTVCNKIFFVAKGLVRSFHLNPNGSEFTRVFVKEGGFCTMLLSFNEHLKSPAAFQAVEETVLLEITEGDFRKIIVESPKLQAVYLRILENYQSYQIQRIEFLTQYSPSQKVEIFHNENPDLAIRLSKKLIASFLQITPETYSRNRKI